jgi:multidrug efflux pump subunit AcrB
VLPSLPTGTQYNVRRMDPTVFPIISYALESDRDPKALQDLAKYQITPLLSSIPGLARVGVQGGETSEVEVLADPHRLADHGMALGDLALAIKAGNVLSAVGQVQDRGRLSLVIADRSAVSSTRSATSWSSPTQPVWCACAMSPRCRMAAYRNGCASSRTASPPCCSTSMSSPMAMPCRSLRRCNGA